MILWLTTNTVEESVKLGNCNLIWVALLNSLMYTALSPRVTTVVRGWNPDPVIMMSSPTVEKV